MMLPFHGSDNLWASVASCGQPDSWASADLCASLAGAGTWDGPEVSLWSSLA